MSPHLVSRTMSSLVLGMIVIAFKLLKIRPSQVNNAATQSLQRETLDQILRVKNSVGDMEEEQGVYTNKEPSKSKENDTEGAKQKQPLWVFTNNDEGLKGPPRILMNFEYSLLISSQLGEPLSGPYNRKIYGV